MFTVKFVYDEEVLAELSTPAEYGELLAAALARRPKAPHALARDDPVYLYAEDDVGERTAIRWCASRL